jgi:hypothetical protein
MQNATTRTVFDVVTDFLAREPSPQEIIDYTLPEDLQARADYLAERNGAGLLTSAEEEELREFVNVDEFFSLLKTKMRLKLKHQKSQSE